MYSLTIAMRQYATNPHDENQFTDHPKRNIEAKTLSPQWS